MIRLTAQEIELILEALRDKYGSGYAVGGVGRLQAKLSIMGEVADRMESHRTKSDGGEEE